jgi:hypothetical protein
MDSESAVLNASVTLFRQGFSLRTFLLITASLHSPDLACVDLSASCVHGLQRIPV